MDMPVSCVHDQYRTIERERSLELREEARK